MLRITLTFDFPHGTEEPQVERIADTVREVGERIYYREIPTGIQPAMVTVDEVAE